MYAYKQEDNTVAICSKQTSIPEGAEQAEVAEVPDRLHRSAWRIVAGAVVTDLPLAVLIAHDKRRAKREEMFAPHDMIIAKHIPGQDAAQAENHRKDIRTADAALQIVIDAIASEVALLELYESEDM
jgi:hypothetical protein